MDILAKNLKALGKNMPELTKKLEEYMNEEKQLDSGAFLDSSLDGNTIAGYEKENRLWYFNSRYYPWDTAQRWADQYAERQYDYAFHMFGFGNGMYLRAINQIKDNAFKILVYEPCADLFCKVLKSIDLSDILSNDANKFIIKDLNDSTLHNYIEAMISVDNINLFDYILTPNYERIFYKDYKELFIKIIMQRDGVYLSRNTMILYAAEFRENLFENLNDMITGCEVGQLEDVIPNDIPAFIVAAGPSLNKNVHELKAAKGKAFIIAVDTALKPLLNAGIIPDLFVTLDPHKPIELFNNDQIQNIPAAVCVVSHYKVLRNHHAKKFFFQYGSPFTGDLYKRQQVELHPLPTGGSVANNAFSLAIMLGFKTIIFVGQDLAFTNDKAMAEGAYDDKNKSSINDDENGYVEVEDINGNPVKTLVNLKHYLDWFEGMIKFHADVHIIDATEGGAKIHGAELMTLKKAVHDFCIGELQEFQEKINNIQPVFTPEQQESLKADLKKLPEQVDHIMKTVQNMLKDYKKLYTCFNSQKYDSKDFSKLIKRIEKNNKKIDSNPILELILLYMQKEDYEIREKIEIYQGDIEKDGINIAAQGITMTKSLKKACGEMKQDYLLITSKFNW